MNNPFSLEGKTVLVTGASSGIGRATAIECSKAGARVIVTGRNMDRLESAFASLEGTGHKIIRADLSVEEEIVKLCEGVDILDGIVHAAGIVKPVPVSFVTGEILDSVMGVNFRFPFLLTRQLLKLKKLNRNSSIVFISSVSGNLVSSVGGSVYSASKGAINGLIKGMALDLAPKFIRVNSVMPGMVDTKIFSGSAITDEQLKEDVKRYPLGRYGRPEEIGYAVIYLLSDAAEWITGSNLLIDGGFTLL